MRIGLVGNQNSGKTTLFNYLTGMNAKIGNWPGVTIEKKTGKIKGTNHEITDLPGIYSLSPYTTEEEVSRNFVFDEKPDIIINIVDSTSLERSLYLTTQLLELDCKVIVALNMADMLNKKGLSIDVAKLSRELGTKVVEISALKETGMDELIKALDGNFVTEKRKIYDENIEKSIEEIETHLGDALLHKRFVAVKLLEQDEGFKKYNSDKITEIIKNTEKNYDTDLEETIATERYSYIEKTKKECIVQKKVSESVSDKLDKIFLNKWLAFPIFVVIMFLVYYLSVGVVGSFTVDWVGDNIGALGEWIRGGLETAGTSAWVSSLVVDGIIAGVGAVLGFVPQLIILFLCISILETTGYMSRISLFLDKVFRKLGLSGKSLIPFIVGSGCSVPGIMSSRIIENEDEKKMTTILTPFIPCSAKLPIISLFAAYFFPENSGIASASLYFFAIAVIFLGALVMNISGTIDGLIIQNLISDLSTTHGSELAAQYPMYADAVTDGTIHTKLWGCYGTALTLMQLVTVITQAFGTTAMPMVTSAYAKGDRKQLKVAINRVLKLTCLVTFPCGIGLAVLADPIMEIVYGGNVAIVGGECLKIMGIAVLFMAGITPICSMLQGVGKVSTPVKLYSLAVIIKVIMNFALVSNVNVNIRGAATGTLVGFLVACVIAMYVLVKATGIRPNFSNGIIKPLVSAILCGGGAFLTYYLLGSRMNIYMATLISIVVAAIIYVLAIIILRTFDENDLGMIKNNEKLAKILAKLRVLK